MNSLNRPISPTLINKCIGVALVPVAAYMAWLGVITLSGFGTSSIENELLFTLLPAACMLAITAFCILFLAKAFQRAQLNKLALTAAFMVIIGVLFMAVLSAWFGDTGTLAGDAAFAGAVLFGLMFLMLYLPATIITGLLAVMGIIALSRSKKE
jgi:hypothetical protein